MNALRTAIIHLHFLCIFDNRGFLGIIPPEKQIHNSYILHIYKKMWQTDGQAYGQTLLEDGARKKQLTGSVVSISDSSLELLSFSSWSTIWSVRDYKNKFSTDRFVEIFKNKSFSFCSASAWFWKNYLIFISIQADVPTFIQKLPHQHPMCWAFLPAKVGICLLALFVFVCLRFPFHVYLL